MTVKSVSTGWFNSDRKPFHTECWRKYHGIKMKKVAIEVVALIDGGFLVFGGGAVLLFLLGTLGLIAVVLSIALLIYLGVTYYRIEK